MWHKLETQLFSTPHPPIFVASPSTPSPRLSPPFYPQDNANFETPRDAVNTSFPVRPGDIILLATDGLFDNMELDDICAVCTVVIDYIMVHNIRVIQVTVSS